MLEVLARFTRGVRESPAVDARSGVSARFAIAGRRDGRRGGAAPRRAARRGRDPVARIGDTESVVGTLRGKVEFESGEEGREIEVLAHLLRMATAETFRARLAGLDLSRVHGLVAEGGTSRPASWSPRPRCSPRSGTVPGLAKVLDRLGLGRAPPGQAAAGVEFVLEGLHLTRRLSKAPDRRRPDGLRRLSSHRALPVRRLAGGPDPLAPPYDVRAAVDEVGEEVLAGGSLREALRDLLRRGPRTAPRPRRPARRGPAGCAARRCAAASSTAR